MRQLTIKSKQLPGNVEANDTAVTIFKGPASSYHASDQEENVFGRVSFDTNHLVARVMSEADPKSEKAPHRELGVRTVDKFCV